MIRKLMVILLGGVISLAGVTGAVAGDYVKQYELKEYEELTGKELTFSEAPVLRTKVAAGELPPVGERLPGEPVVLEPVEEIGQYGGTIRVDTPKLEAEVYERWFVAGEEILLTLSADGKTILPNLAKDWDFAEDGKTLTLYLRKGIKWSDGAPFTADDIMYWWEDEIMNDELYPIKPKDWSPGGEPMGVERIDDYTIRLHFAAPYPLAPLMLAVGGTAHSVFYRPKHYLKQFNPSYTSVEELNEMAVEAGYEFWYQLYLDRINEKIYRIPTLRSFIYVAEKELDYVLSDRNPYYWKVDTAGNQLPYADNILTTAVGDIETRTARAISGLVDFEGYTTTMDNMSLYKANEEKGDYRVLIWPSAYSQEVVYMPNQTAKDPVLRQIFRDIRFRRAISLAINREEINQVVYFGLATMGQTTVAPSSRYYEEEFARAYAQYDPEEANRFLDEMNLKWDSNHEWRLRPDGKKLSIVLTHISVEETPITAISELVKEYWKAIGIDLLIKSVGWGPLMTQWNANEIEMGAIWAWNIHDLMLPIDGSVFIPTAWMTLNDWCPEWNKWLSSGGESGEEPPEEIKRIKRLWEEQQETLDDNERVRLIKEILRSQSVNLWTIGIGGGSPHPVIVKNNFRNVPERVDDGWGTIPVLLQRPEQYFLRQE